MSIQLGVCLIRDVATPGYATPGSAAFDLEVGAFLSSAGVPPVESPGDDDMGFTELHLQSGRQVWVGTGIIADIPAGFGLMIVPRSGVGTKKGLVLGNGTAVIDSDYRSEIKLALMNRSKVAIPIERHMRVAQAWLVPAPQAEIIQVDSVESTGRGGFGSTGIARELEEPLREEEFPKLFPEED